MRVSLSDDAAVMTSPVATGHADSWMRPDQKQTLRSADSMAMISVTTRWKEASSPQE